MKVTRKEIKGLYELATVMEKLSKKGVEWTVGARATLADLWIRLSVASWYGVWRSINYDFANEDMENLWNLFLDLGEYVVGNHNDFVIEEPGLTRSDMVKYMDFVGGLLSDLFIVHLFAKYKRGAAPRYRKVTSLEYPPITLHVNMLISREPDDARNIQVIFSFTEGELPSFMICSDDYEQSSESPTYEIGCEENSLVFAGLCKILEKERIDKFFA